jgi:glycine cleavage system H protein
VANYPANLKYAASHEWVRVEGEVAVIGLTAFALEQLTDLIVMDLAKPGTKVKQGGRLGEVESVKSVSDIYAPVGGEVIEVNQAIVNDLSKLPADPYGDGWLVKLKLENAADLNSLLTAEAYQAAVAAADH